MVRQYLPQINETEKQIRVQSNLPCQEKKKNTKEMLHWNKEKKERKERKSREWEKKKITTEGKEKIEKAKQLMEGTDESKGKYKKRK